VIPAPSVSEALAEEIGEVALKLVRRLGVRGLLNMQLAVKDGALYVLEANPRASRTVPFVAKATGVPVVDLACRLMLGAPVAELDLPERALPTRAWAKEAVFPADRFAGAADRSPEMRSTGEVMAGGATVSEAYARVQRAAGRSRRHGRVGPPLQVSRP
jgi:carbamoyl-phosphate synthase large subunit